MLAICKIKQNSLKYNRMVGIFPYIEIKFLFQKQTQKKNN